MAAVIPNVRPTPLPSGTGTLQVRCSRSEPALLTESASERYTLDVTPTGARIDAQTPTGILRGLATMQQLVRVGADGIPAQAVHIEDAPRFGWRGLMLDVSSHFAATDVILRTLDMESVKLNVLHLHLSDNEGVPRRERDHRADVCTPGARTVDRDRARRGRSP